MRRIIVGMSGGVDSAAAAYLLKLAGYDVIGVTLRTWQTADGADSRCCEIDDAGAAADHIGIPYYVINSLAPFRSRIIEPFTEAYLAGQTPNPCVLCNRTVKWEGLLEAAKVMQADAVATGHYAQLRQLPNGRMTVQTGMYAQKDQSYMLYRLSQEQLRATIFPLGRLSKPEVRQIAAQAGLTAANKPDSQEICFVTDGSFSDFIEQNTDEPLPPEGDFVDASGKVVGRHQGIYRYTIGQRKGLGLALGYPAYVTRIDPKTNTITVGPESELYTSEIRCTDLQFMGLPEMQPGERQQAAVKIRYHHPAQAAELLMQQDGVLQIRFEQPVRAAAPGQSAVFYDAEGCILGGGLIA